MPNRILKESICTSENIDRLSAFHETVFYRLLVTCDDFGRMDARPKILASRLFPLKDIRASQIEEALRALTSAELVDLYDVDGKPFLQMKTWDRHQQIRAKKSRFPAPDESIRKQLHADEIICKQTQADASKCPRNPIQSNPNPIRERETRAGAREDVVEPENDLGRVMSYYMDKINPTPSAMAIECLKGYTRSLSADVVLHALQVAQDERKTGWSYIHAILSRYERDGLKTLDAVMRDEQDRTAQKTAPAAKPNQITGSSKSRFTGQELSSLLDGLEAI